ncbi:sigma-54 interaction domain-containing protein [Bradyrhizobium niftali]|uniref:Sigma-54-dependent Fis family transcriptional regulator n=1 Tax=Bradyrhizobium niftali TaxID=2560055 RepID=A0A4Y9M346_9BRAD|nr:sigma-54 dependent transcriptional regulator [Bradyrhizobium niftali]TFV49619.1 sigma-54-dependent Fis family transcriptional regulator [Bradyrhizobium niftali]
MTSLNDAPKFLQAKSKRTVGLDIDQDRRELRALQLQFGICGDSPALVDAVKLARQFALSEAPVLLQGATGVGKEVFARAIHYLSGRHSQPFVPINCGAIPEGLVEAEFFGATKGAFTGASANREGLVELAHTGTLFLDEVDCLPPKGQVSLLRFLQEHEFRRVGGGAVRKVDVRLIAATNANLEQKVAAGDFRQDLLFRLDVCNCIIPELAERRSDIPLLAVHFLEKLAARYARSVPVLAPAAIDWLCSREWPGNLRQLENVMHRAVAALTGDEIDADLLLRIWPTAAKASPRAGADRDALTEGPLIKARKRVAFEFEDRYLRQLMAEVGGNVSEAARRAGTERRALGRMLKRHGIGRSGLR